jgi:hypothetical protein
VSAELLSSKVAIVEEEPRVRAIPTLPTAVVGAVGVTERGPVNQPVLVSTFDELVATFGGYTPNSDLALAARGFFENGGRTLWVVRTVHHGDVNDATTKTSAAASVDLEDRAAVPQPTLRVDARWDGTWGNDLRVVVRAASSGAADELDLAIEDDGRTVESFPNLSMTPAAPRYVERVVNAARGGSRLIRVTDLRSTSPSPTNLPALGPSALLAGGDDGLTGLDDMDFIGSPVGATGLHALDTVQDLSIVIVPGRATTAVALAMIAYCETTRDRACFAILDPPGGLGAAGIVEYVQSTAGLLGLSEYGAIYWPRLRVPNPSRRVFGPADDLVVPPSGHIAGVYSRVDASRPGGVYQPPAGTEKGRLFGVLGFEIDETLLEAKRDLVFPKRINPLTTLGPMFIDGARTLKGDGAFPSVSERRGAIFIEQAIRTGVQFARHEPNTESLRAQLHRTVTAFLLQQLQNGAFASTDPQSAFFVDFSDELNTPATVFAGQVVGRIGLAMAKPAEFVVLRFSADTRALEAQLSGGG